MKSRTRRARRSTRLPGCAGSSPSSSGMLCERSTTKRTVTCSLDCRRRGSARASARAATPRQRSTSAIHGLGSTRLSRGRARNTKTGRSPRRSSHQGASNSRPARVRPISARLVPMGPSNRPPTPRRPRTAAAAARRGSQAPAITSRSRSTNSRTAAAKTRPSATPIGSARPPSPARARAPPARRSERRRRPARSKSRPPPASRAASAFVARKSSPSFMVANRPRPGGVLGFPRPAGDDQSEGGPRQPGMEVGYHATGTYARGPGCGRPGGRQSAILIQQPRPARRRPRGCPAIPQGRNGITRKPGTRENSSTLFVRMDTPWWRAVAAIIKS